MRKFSIFLALSSLMLITCNAWAGKIINEHLPDWLEVDLSLRHRYEYQDNFDFNNSADDSKGFHLWRSRLGIGVKPAKDLKLFYQFYDARISHDSTRGGAKAAFENWTDTRQLWMEYKTDFLSLEKIGLTDTTIKMGRQDFGYGSQRLLGPVEWSNVGQTFDAGKLSLNFEGHKFKVDIFGGHKTNNKSPRESDDLYDGSANDILGGYYAVYKGWKDVTFDQYVLSRNTDGKTVSFGQTGDGEVEDYTIGFILKGKIKDTHFDYELEAARQVGNSGSLDVNAQMAVGIIGYTFDHAWKPRVSFEFDYGSGDSDKNDDDRQTFDNLYPTNHLHYGYMDFASLQNLNNYRFQLKVKPNEKLEVSTDLHLIYLDTPKDNLYSSGRSIKRAATASADDPHVGNEVDLLAKYKVNSFTNVMAGYSHFWAGDFLSDTGADDDADYVYVQTVLDF